MNDAAETVERTTPIWSGCLALFFIVFPRRFLTIQNSTRIAAIASWESRFDQRRESFALPNDRNSKRMRPAAIVSCRRWRDQVGRLAALILLAGCATAPKPPLAPAAVPVPPVEPGQPLAQLQAYAVKPAIGTECVPYARQRSGISIMGDAYTWWDTAAGHYQRGSLPLAGAVLVLRKSERLRRGHLAFVTAVTGPREIRVDHANWQPDALITGMAVMDVSEKNDWTQLRFWNKDTRKWGRIYPAAGFIYNVPDGVIPPGTTTVSSGNSQGSLAPQQSAP
jgi:hypothetical protein